MGWYVAPNGTVTVKLVAVATDTVAWVAPKKTILLEGVELKLMPVMVTDVPISPLVGAKLLMVGGPIVVALMVLELLELPPMFDARTR